MNGLIIYYDENVKKILEAFCNRFGGNVGIRGSKVAYLCSDDKTVYIQPWNEAEDEFISMLQESVTSGRNLIPERWRLYVLPGPNVLE